MTNPTLDRALALVDVLDIPDRTSAVIGGEWVSEPRDAGVETIPVEDPSTAAVFAEIVSASDDTIEQAMGAARRAGGSWWRETSPAARGRAMAEVAHLIARDAEDIAILESLDTGKPLWQTRLDVESSRRYFEYYAGYCDKQFGTTIPLPQDKLAYSIFEPYGVSLHITPWNSPVVQMCRGIAPAMVTGNAVVVKPSELTPLTTLYFARLLRESTLPPGLCGVLLGTGATVGTSAVTHPAVAQVSFTGSVATGSAVMAMASRRIVPCNLELGGKSATIVMPDADIGAAAEAAVNAMVRNAGQSCLATTRMLVHRSRVDEFVDLATTRASGIRLDHALANADMGPVASKAQLSKIRRLVETAADDGASAIVCAELPELPSGYYVQPTLLAGVTNDMTAVREEIFGPVQSILAFDTVDEAIAMANDSEYGLSAGVFTKNFDSAHAIAQRLESGQVHINAYPAGGIETPFGGYKRSGIGREKGAAGLDGYRQIKTIIAALDNSRERP